MTRLATSGFESQIFSSTALLNGETENTGTGTQSLSFGTPTFDTTNHRSGLACMTTATQATGHRWTPTMVLDRNYFIRGYFRVQGLPLSNHMFIFGVTANAVQVGAVRINLTSSQLQLFESNSTLLASSPAITANTWYRLEMEIMIPTAGNGTLGFWLDGVQIYRDTNVDVNNSVTTAQVNMGWVTNLAPGQTILVDDVAINDNQGAQQNSLPGPGKIALLKPTAVAALGTSWEGPQTTGSDTTNLQTSVDNTPPLGVAHADTDANNDRYVFNAASVNSNFDVTCATYTSMGIRDADWVNVLQALVRASTNSATGTNDAVIRLVSGPADAGDTTVNLELNAIAGTEPAGWKSYRTPVVYDPIVGETTAPVVRFAKNTGGSTRVWMADLMGVLVEYHPSSTIFLPAGVRNHYLVGQ